MVSALAAGILGGTGLIGSIVGGETQASAATSAANTQAQAALQGAQIQQQTADQALAAQLSIFGQTRSDLLPYQAVGQSAVNPLMYGLGIGGTADSGSWTVSAQGSEPTNSATIGGSGNVTLPGNSGAPAITINGTSPPAVPTGNIPPGMTYGGLLATPAAWQPTMAQLAATPGYQFNLQQGTESAQNSFAAQGLGGSGAAMKGGINYAEGLAETTYNQQFNIYQQQYQNQLASQQQQFGMLSSALGIGQNAANQTGAYGTTTGNNAANTLMAAGNAAAGGITGAANASAAGTIGSANAISSAISGGIGSLNNVASLYALSQSNMFSNAQ